MNGYDNSVPFVNYKALESLLIEDEEIATENNNLNSNSEYQKIFDEIEDYLPTDWKKVVVYIAYGKGCYTIKYYIKGSDDAYVDCFNQTKNKAKLTKAFLRINKIVSKSRMTKNPWTVMTIIIDSNGHIKTNYSYDNISENMIEYEKSWKKKYLV